MIKIYIYENNNKGFKWYNDGSNYAKGYAFYKKKYYENNDILILFQKEDFDINKVNGCYVFIKKSKNKITIYTDLFNTFQIYYYLDKNHLYISDKVENIITNAKKYNINENAKIDWAYGGFVTCNETLIKDIYNIPFGSEFNYSDSNNEISIKEYINHLYESVKYNEYDEAYKDFNIALNNLYNNAKKALFNKKVILFLSGGVDSKFCAYILNEIKHEDVLCVIYGKKNNQEMKNAISTAKKLNFKYILLPYNKKDYRKLFNSKDNKDYFINASNFNNTPHTMDYFAMKYLEGNGYIHKNTIFMQGQVGLIVSNSSYNNEMSRDSIVKNEVSNCHYYYNPNTIAYKMMKPRLTENLSRFDYELNSKRDYIGLVNSLGYDNFRVNHILKALKTIEYFNAKYYMPMMDYDLYSFFKTFSYDLINKKYFLKKFIKDEVDIIPYSNPNILYKKILRNFLDPRYNCINIKDIIFNKIDGVNIPNVFVRFYRSYRNFLTYYSSKTYFILIEELKRLKNEEK